MRIVAITVLFVLPVVAGSGIDEDREAAKCRVRAELLAREDGVIGELKAALRERLTFQVTLLSSNIQLSDEQKSRMAALLAGESWRERINKLAMAGIERGSLLSKLERDVARVRPGAPSLRVWPSDVDEDVLRGLERSGVITRDRGAKIRSVQRAHDELLRILRRSVLELLNEAQMKHLSERDRQLLGPRPLA